MDDPKKTTLRLVIHTISIIMVINIIILKNIIIFFFIINIIIIMIMIILFIIKKNLSNISLFHWLLIKPRDDFHIN
ncbi:hypothetical protein M8J76_007357 [Diaphorina citri]|nr:hypothetical protein M8J76_007357 [Diaphorina citri]